MTEETIFADAILRQDPTERSAFLDEACAGDKTLRRRVEALLGSHEAADPFLRQPVLSQMAATNSTADRSPLSPETPDGDRSASRTATDVSESDAVVRLLEPARRSGSLGRLKYYEILEVVGKGGFGTVLKAFDEKLHRVVAIKVLAPELAASGVARQRFLREARAAAAIRHEHVIDIHVVDEDPIPHLVMEFNDGQTLQQKLDRTGVLSVKEILRIGMQIAEGLAAAHKQGLIHRDIKPANILLENGVERVKLSDFGLARAVDDASLTQSGMVAGTPLFMSPEQAEGRYLDQRSDLFSLGSILYAMCTGQPPFRAESSLAVLRRVCDDTPHPIRDLNSDIPEWLAAIIAKLHAKKPEDRIQSAREVAEMLAKSLAEIQVGAASKGERQEPLASRVAPRTRRLALLVPLGLVILGSFASWLVLARPWRVSDSKQAGHNVAAPQANPLDRLQSKGALDLPPTYKPGPVRNIPTALELARQASPADMLNLQDTLPALTLKAGGDPGKVSAELVAILGKGPFLHKEHGGSAEVTSVAYSPGGKFVASANARYDLQSRTFTGCEVKLWEADTGKAVRDFPGHADVIFAVAFSPDGQHLLTGCRDGAVKVWDVATAKEVQDLAGQVVKVRSVAYSPDGKLIASGASDTGSKLIVWDAANGATKFSSDQQGAGILHVSFSPDSRLLASVGEIGDDSVRIWATATGQEIARLNTNPGGSRGAVFSADNKRLVLVGQNNVGQVWDIATQELAFELKGHTSWILGVARSTDGAHLATAGLDGTVRLWDAATGQLIRTCSGHPGGANSVAFHPDGKTLACGDGAGQIHIWEVATGKHLFPSQHTGQVRAVAVSSDGTLLASAGADATVRLWDLATGQMRHLLTGHHNMVQAVAISPDVHTLASAGDDRTVRLWDAGTGKHLRTLIGHDDAIWQVAFAPDGKTIASAGLDGCVKLWDVKAGTLLANLRGAGACACVAFSPDGTTLAAGDDRIIRLWDLRTNASVAALHGHASPVRSLAFHPDGQTLASSADNADPAVRLWDLSALKEKRVLTGHAGTVLSCTWRADGGVLFSCGAVDSTVRFWDLTAAQPRGHELLLFPAGTHFLHGLALTPEGRYLATANPDGTVYVHKLSARP